MSNIYDVVGMSPEQEKILREVKEKLGELKRTALEPLIHHNEQRLFLDDGQSPHDVGIRPIGYVPSPHDVGTVGTSIRTVQCKRCGCRWIPRVADPMKCARCHSVHWH